MTAQLGSGKNEKARAWSIEELRVLAAIYFNANFSIGDDARDECRTIADCFGRTPSSIDRQWRNVDAVVKGKNGNIGNLVRRATADYLDNPKGCRAVAVSVCIEQGWPLESLILEGRQAPLRSVEIADDARALRAAFQGLLDHLDFKMFASGSQGFYCQGKITLGTERFQAQTTAVLIGSRQNLAVTMRASRDEVTFALLPLLDTLQAKRFKTGRVGFYTNGKVQVGSERFQVAMQAVQIGNR